MTRLRTIENMPGVIYQESKKYTFFVEDLQGLDNRIYDLEIAGGGILGNPFLITTNRTIGENSVYFLYDILEINEDIIFEVGENSVIMFIKDL